MSFRASKVRHVVGALDKKENWYPDLRPSTNTGEANCVAASCSKVAVVSDSGGSIAILDAENKGKRTDSYFKINAHASQIYDIKFSPFDDNLLASSADDGHVKVWQLPEGSLTEDISNAAFDLVGHKRRVSSVAFHPTANNVIASGSADKQIKVWDFAAEAEKLTLTMDGGVYDMSWNYNGSLLGSVSNDNKIRVWDPRQQLQVQIGDCHNGTKPSKIQWLGNWNKIVTTGFSKTRSRQICIWDSRNLAAALSTQNVDSGTGILCPLYDEDTHLLWVAGKGDGIIRVFELTDNKPFYNELSKFSQDIPMKSISLFPKRGVDVMDVEVARLMKLSANAVIPIKFNVPRKSKKYFATDIFPDSRATTAALTADVWFAGHNKNPVLASLDPETAESESADAQAEDNGEKEEEEIKDNAEENEASGKKFHLVRSSHFRHITGKPAMKTGQFLDLRMNFASSDTSPISCSRKYFAVPWAGIGGLLGVFPLSKPGRISSTPGVIETGSGICDFQFNPFADDRIAVSSEDSHIRVFKVTDDVHTSKTNLSTPELDLTGHTRKAVFLKYHPVAENILSSFSVDKTVKLWDVEAQQDKFTITQPDLLYWMDFNYDGSQMVGTTKTRKLRLWDPRSCTITSETNCHVGAKPSRVVWLGNTDKLFTTGFSQSDRELSLWDIKKLDKPISTVAVDNLSGPFTPIFDEDNSIVYLSGKGDGTISFWEITDDAPHIHLCGKYTTSVPAVGICALHKTLNDVRKVEIMRILKLTTTSMEPTSFKVPRTRKEYFQDDIIPKTRGTVAGIGGKEWVEGSNRKPVLLSLQPAGMPLLSSAPPLNTCSKYNFAEEVAKKNEEDAISKEKVMDKFYSKITQDWKEDENTQNEDEGCDDDEWSD